MEIPSEFISLGVGGVTALLGRAVFGLIARNKVDSDKEDKNLFEYIHGVDDKYRDIDREQYKMIGEVREELAYYRGWRDCLKEQGKFEL